MTATYLRLRHRHEGAGGIDCVDGTAAIAADQRGSWQRRRCGHDHVMGSQRGCGEEWVRGYVGSG